MNLGIVTSCHGYSQYLREWAESIIGLTRTPDFIGIVTHGTAEDGDAGALAAKQLTECGFHVKHQHFPALLDFGQARNFAIRMSATEWVMHLDADDMLMPHAIEDMEGLASRADVISLGYERTGDLASGPKMRTKLYKSGVGREILANPTPSSGVSPFRRSFWERSPYRTDMEGGWDTALWLGFAHLGARFVATKRPCFWYRQHGDSLFNTRRKAGWSQERTGQKLQSLRRGDRGVAVIVPYGPDNGPRDKAWKWLEARYRKVFPEWPVHVGTSRPNQWRKGEAIERALATCRAEILVIADADCVVRPEALRLAVELVETGKAPWVVPHTTVNRLGEAETGQWLASPPDRTDLAFGDLIRPPYLGTAGGGIVVVRRSDYQACGGIPKAFVGWGGEDDALGVILDTMLGAHTRLENPLVHLWHPLQHDHRDYAGKRVTPARALYNRYLRASGNVSEMWTLVKGNVSPHLAGYRDPLVRHGSFMKRQEAIRHEVVHAVRDRFAEAKLAAQRSPVMGLARDLKHQHLKTLREQRIRNEEAIRERREREEKLAPKPANKMKPPPENKGIRFASEEAEKLARASGLRYESFEGVTPAGPRGISLAQVKELVP